MSGRHTRCGEHTPDKRPRDILGAHNRRVTQQGVSEGTVIHGWTSFMLNELTYTKHTHVLWVCHEFLHQLYGWLCRPLYVYIVHTVSFNAYIHLVITDSQKKNTASKNYTTTIIQSVPKLKQTDMFYFQQKVLPCL